MFQKSFHNNVNKSQKKNKSATLIQLWVNLAGKKRELCKLKYKSIKRTNQVKFNTNN